jgi:hypothetical protein
MWLISERKRNVNSILMKEQIRPDSIQKILQLELDKSRCEQLAGMNATPSEQVVELISRKYAICITQETLKGSIAHLIPQTVALDRMLPLHTLMLTDIDNTLKRQRRVTEKADERKALQRLAQQEFMKQPVKPSNKQSTFLPKHLQGGGPSPPVFTQAQSRPSSLYARPSSSSTGTRKRTVLLLSPST